VISGALLSAHPADLRLERSRDRASSHVLVNAADQSRVRVIGADETWPDGEVKNALKGGEGLSRRVANRQF
jgi:hypothetical protein